VNQDTHPYAYRRHLRKCRYFGPGGRDVSSNLCNCPLHVDGKYRGERLRDSLNTRNVRLAERRLADRLRKIDEKSESDDPTSNTKTCPTVRVAVDRFLKSHGVMGEDNNFTGDIEYSSYGKYRTKLYLLRSFCEREGITELADVNLDALEDYRNTRKIGQVTWKVELQALRTFFSYCIAHKWISSNPAREMKSPRNIKPNEVVPYTLREEGDILAACDRIGGAKYKRSAAVYERLRARAMILVLRHTALRISDVATLPKCAVTWDKECRRWRVFIRTQKSGEPVFLPIPQSVKLALDLVPLPRNAPQDCPTTFGTDKPRGAPSWESQSGRWRRCSRNQALRMPTPTAIAIRSRPVS
jgi:integrase